MPDGLEHFLTELSRGLGSSVVAANKELTIRDRIRRLWSAKQCAQFLNVSHEVFLSAANEFPDFPSGEQSGRDVLFTLKDLMHIRALLASKAEHPESYLAWRAPGSALPVISIASQKGGTAKSLTGAHLAQYLSLNFGMRVGVMDADPQSTITLYFVGGDEFPKMPTQQTPTMVDFAGLYMSPGGQPYTSHDPKTLDSFFKKTSWPGIRVLPAHGETSEGEIQIARLIRDRVPGKNFYRFLHDAIEVWKEGHEPSTLPNDLILNGRVDQQRLQRALTETFDCLIIDYQPALTLFQLNNFVASTSLVIPQTMKGFDIATLHTFVKGLMRMLASIQKIERLDIAPGPHMLLPTIVQSINEQDLKQISNLMEECPEQALPVYYQRSDAIANASDLYMSAYEYEPETPGRRVGIKRFIRNANAVNDAIVSRIWPGLGRGYADLWINEVYQD